MIYISFLFSFLYIIILFLLSSSKRKDIIIFFFLIKSLMTRNIAKRKIIMNNYDI
ncbi:hypothetical protein H8356DRAFT_1742227 [Neocallimastix lanati (nom. inval.)]|uniref:Uncharacterized protein n=1 Tax=Neocallimastix californiae TaxID=1754190 RepID=A0A1Y2F5G0_9FUNG|nr:hypothetical protein H8356DRAFT_1742227 [Neocallimastix sp. JGI-2020a]ORY79132.1 hypothetical protein LY90DRAFT_60755 [Neocallimastix californiae]|eukprot:ORY79132.1 hypothetical protein LY90DRAFT_60755 [Neocallimastix californiae]